MSADQVMQTNFNHERLTIAISVTCQARAALAAAFAYVMRRQAFGKALIEQPVVRHRLAKAGAEMETQWAWVSNLEDSNVRWFFRGHVELYGLPLPGMRPVLIGSSTLV